MALGILAGLLCGILSGMGLGGGSLLIVWLTAAAGLGQRTAQGINLLYFLPTAFAAAVVHIRRGQVDFNAAVPAMLAGALSAALGALLARRMDVALLRTLFGVLLLFTGVTELRKAFLKP